MNAVKEYKLEVGKPSVNAAEASEAELQMAVALMEAKRTITAAGALIKPLDEAVRNLVHRVGGSLRAGEGTLVVKVQTTGYTFSEEVQAMEEALELAKDREKEDGTAVPKTTLKMEFTDHRKLPPLKALAEADEAESAAVEGSKLLDRVTGVLKRIWKRDDEARG